MQGVKKERCRFEKKSPFLILQEPKPWWRAIKREWNMAAPSSFFNKESICEFSFQRAVREAGPFWHYCTPGQRNESVNITEDDFRFSVNNLAISAAEAGACVVTDAHMSNHLHVLMGGKREQCFLFEEAFLYRLRKRLAAQGRRVDLGKYRCPDPIAVTDLDMMRNEIVYINRNGFVADFRYTPFSFPWSGGSVYFNLREPLDGAVPFNSLTYREKRRVSLRSEPVVPDSYLYKDGRILPSSYLNYKLGESLFRDAHHYFSLLSKNVESFSLIAKRLGDKVVVTDEEMYNLLASIAKRDYKLNQASLLPPQEKIKLAKMMRYDYNSSDSQIQRLLRLDPSVVRELFPK